MEKKPQSLTQRLISQNFQGRLFWIRLVFFLIFAVVLARAFYLQVLERSRYLRIANRGENSAVAVKLRRGPIYDANGDILAVSLPLQSVFAIPREINRAADTARKLSRVLKLPYQQVLRKLNSDISFTWIKRNTRPEESDTLQQMELEGIHFIEEYQRFYPMGSHASHVLGFSGIDSQGLEGIEYKFNQHLMDNSGISGVWNYFRNASSLKTLSGGFLQLTIQSKIQHYTEKELRKAIAGSRAENGVAIVMETRTGKILAMANMPDYDPNNFDRYDASRYFNRAVNATYEPGSTFKVITIATALDSDTLKEDSIFYCEEGQYQIQDRVIHDVAEYGWLPLEKILKKSSNICAAKIGQRIPKSIFYKSIRDFGFGTETGIELPGEVSGKVFNYQNWSDTDVATMSFGHSISATPIQIITAINAIATGGTLIKPRVIESAHRSDQTLIHLENKGQRRILKRETADIVKTFMESVVRPGGTGVLARVDGVSIAGKTGTTRKFDIRERKYSTTEHISSFIGFFPSQDPLLTILVIIDEPKQEYLGTKGAAPVFREIAEHALRFYPETMERQKDRKVTPVVNTLFSTRPAEETSTALSMINVADSFRGLTLRQALQKADKLQIQVEARGSGIVRQVLPGAANEKRFTLILR